MTVQITKLLLSNKMKIQKKSEKKKKKYCRNQIERVSFKCYLNVSFGLTN